MGNLDFNRMSIAQFIAWEATQDDRYEWIDGEVFAMTGGTYAHDRVRTNLSAALLGHLRGTPCRVVGPEIKLRIDTESPGYYPDLFVICRPISAQTVELFEAKVIVEVLSPSTEKKDRGAKWSDFQRIQQLEEFILIDPDKRRIEIYRRIAPSDWRLHICSAQELVRFESIDFSTSFEVIFEDVSPS